MSICHVTYDLNNYLDKQEKALAEFTSCLPEYRDRVANEVMALFCGEKSDEEFCDVFPDQDNQFEIVTISAIGVGVLAYSASFPLEKTKELIKEAIEYYSEVLYNCSLEEMLEDNDGTTLESWIESVL
jgi:hypothetical protein